VDEQATFVQVESPPLEQHVETHVECTGLGIALLYDHPDCNHPNFDGTRKKSAEGIRVMPIDRIWRRTRNQTSHLGLYSGVPDK
jgi:hypothetical protein